MKRKTIAWGLVCLAVVAAAVMILTSGGGSNNAPLADFRSRLSAKGSIVLSQEGKRREFTGEDKLKLVEAINGLQLDPIEGPERTPAPGHLWSLRSKAEDGSTEASIYVTGWQQEIVVYVDDEIFDYKLSTEEYLKFLEGLEELFYT